MSTRLGTWVVAALALGVAYGLACTTGGGQEPDRFATLEARLSRLEAMLSADSGPSLENGVEAAAPLWDPDAGRADRGPAAMAPPPPTPERQVAECVRMSEFNCRQRGLAGKPPARPGDGGFAWFRPDDVGPDASAAGRKCLDEERQRCIHEASRKEKLRAWLDAQLTPDRVDRGLSDSLLAAAERAGQVAPGSATLDCVKEFCRLAPKPGKSDAGARGTPFATLCREGCQSIQFHDAVYTTRDGHRFPN